MKPSPSEYPEVLIPSLDGAWDPYRFYEGPNHGHRINDIRAVHQAAKWNDLLRDHLASRIQSTYYLMTTKSKTLLLSELMEMLISLRFGDSATANYPTGLESLQKGGPPRYVE